MVRGGKKVFSSDRLLLSHSSALLPGLASLLLATTTTPTRSTVLENVLASISVTRHSSASAHDADFCQRVIWCLEHRIRTRDAVPLFCALLCKLLPRVGLVIRSLRLGFVTLRLLLAALAASLSLSFLFCCELLGPWLRRGGRRGGGCGWGW